MARKLPIHLALLIGLLLAVSHAQRLSTRSPVPISPSSSAMQLYESLLAGTEQAEGDFHIDLIPGTWRTNMNGRVLLWAIFPNTTVAISINSGPASASTYRFEFYPSLALALLGPQMISGTLKSFDYNPHDGITNFDFAVNDADNNKMGLPVLISQFIPRTIGDILKGTPFASSSHLQKCSKEDGTKCFTASTMVANVEYSADGDRPLHLHLRAGASLKLGLPDLPGGLRGDVTLSTESELILSHLSFTVVERRIDGQLGSSSLALASANFAMNGMYLKANEGMFSFESLQFSGSTGQSGHIVIRNGSLALKLRAPSSVQLAGTSNEGLILDLDDGAKITASGVQIAIDDKYGSTFTDSGPFELTGATTGGNLSFGRRGYLAIAGGQVNAALHHLVFTSNGHPTASGTVAGTLLFGPGRIYLRPDSSVAVLGGSASAISLHLDSSASPAVTGVFSEMALNFANRSEFTVPGGMMIRLKGVGHLASNDSANPLTIGVASESPFGSYSLDLNFDILRNAPGGTLVLYDGHITLPLIVGQAGQVSGRAIQGTGTFHLVQANVNQDLSLTLTDVNMSQDSPTTSQEGSGSWTANVSFPQAQAIYVPGHRTDLPHC
jgi:hypothetical protein